ncbi:hypothetical protein B0T37_10230 [Chromobacterium violaceum]|uniref:hypothetical protein n=1 Tax=Chromobacterium violaceum TaxID=536 RepID=UPI0009DB5D05|nr:hypothetical protein [Chromobacterium violaceum]OQS10017.1 hypothetical protein B0T38_10625 [Chromobacterium violaceum]OQS26432.1 hypothetical protein B0T37_10230 [Chromobacterium violaceum]
MLNPISAIGAQAFSQSGDGVQSLQQRVAVAADAASSASSASGAQLQAFLQAVRDLPPPLADSPQAKQEQIDAIARLLREFGEGGQPAFPTLAQQLEVIDMALKEEGEASPLREPLMGVMVSLGNLQFQMDKWMQDTMLSDGKPEEFESW